MRTLADVVAKTAQAHAGHKWILAFGASASLAGFVDLLSDWGHDGVLVVSAVPGVGDPPDALTHFTGAAGVSTMDGIRNFQRSIIEPDDATQAAVDAFDPDGVARVITEPFNASSHLLGRRVFGPRRSSWLALEDKTVVDDLWDKAGVPRAPSAVVSVAEATEAAAGLAGELGTVWAADTRQGWHGGASYTRWVLDEADADEATNWFRSRAHQVRVMPFLEGIPCSIHGYVASDGVAAFRPVEMLILRAADRTFHYAGPATFWDPPGDIRQEMRIAAARTAEYLAATVGYIGSFSIDGVCTAEGFRPTEINTRYSAGIGIMARAIDVPLGAVTRALVEGRITVPAGLLEEAILTEADATRIGGIGMPIEIETTPQEMGVTFGDGRAHRVPVGEGWGDMKLGPSSHGSYLLMRLDPEQVPAGRSSAPLAAAAAALASAEWDLGLPELNWAYDVTSGSR